MIAVSVLAAPLLGLGCERAPRVPPSPACTLEDVVAGRCPESTSYEEADVVVHRSWGRIIRNEVAVYFNDGVTPDQAFAVIQALPAEVVSYAPYTNRYTVRLPGEPSLDDLDAVIARLDHEPSVYTVTASQVGGPF